MNIFKKISSFFKELFRDELGEEFKRTMELQRDIENGRRAIAVCHLEDKRKYIVMEIAELKNTIKVCNDAELRIEKILNGLPLGQKIYDDHNSTQKDFIRFEFETKAKLVIQENLLVRIDNEIYNHQQAMKGVNENRSDNRKVCSIP